MIDQSRADQIFDGVMNAKQPQEENAFTTNRALEIMDSTINYNKANEGRTFGGTLKDIAVTGAKSVVSAGESAVGLADLATMGRAGKFMEDTFGYDPKATHEFLGDYYSSAQKAANQAVAESNGFWNKVKTAIENPSTIGHAVLESAPSMMGGAAVGRGVMKIAPNVAPWLAAVIGEGVIQAGSSAEGTRQGAEGGVLSPKQTAMSIGSGVGTGIFGAVGGRIAKRLGIDDIDTLLAGGRASVAEEVGKGFASKVGDVAKRIVAGGISEGVFEELPQSIQEQIWSNAALNQPLMQGVDQSAAMGLLTGAAMGGGANLVRLSGVDPDIKTDADPEDLAAKTKVPTQMVPEEEITDLDRKITNLERMKNPPPAAKANLEAYRARRDELNEQSRDQKIKEFEQNLKQAQEDIQEYPPQPPIQPDVESLRREYRDSKFVDNEGRRESIRSESADFEEYLDRMGIIPTDEEVSWENDIARQRKKATEKAEDERHWTNERENIKNQQNQKKALALRERIRKIFEKKNLTEKDRKQVESLAHEIKTLGNFDFAAIERKVNDAKINAALSDAEQAGRQKEIDTQKLEDPTPPPPEKMAEKQMAEKKEVRNLTSSQENLSKSEPADPETATGRSQEKASSIPSKQSMTLAEAKRELGILKRYPKLSDNPEKEIADLERVVADLEKNNTSSASEPSAPQGVASENPPQASEPSSNRGGASKTNITVKDMDKNGDVLIQDGVTRRVDMFDEVSVEGIKRGGDKGGDKGKKSVVAEPEKVAAEQVVEKKQIGQPVDWVNKKNNSDIPIKHRSGNGTPIQYRKGQAWADEKILDKNYDGAARIGFDNTQRARAQHVNGIGSSKIKQFPDNGRNTRDRAFWQGVIDQANARYSEDFNAVMDQAENNTPSAPKGATQGVTSTQNKAEEPQQSTGSNSRPASSTSSQKLVLPDIRPKSGRPYKTEKAAQRGIDQAGAKDTHEVVAVDGGFVGREKIQPEPEPLKDVAELEPLAKTLWEIKADTDKNAGKGVSVSLRNIASQLPADAAYRFFKIDARGHKKIEELRKKLAEYGLTDKAALKQLRGKFPHLKQKQDKATKQDQNNSSEVTEGSGKAIYDILKKAEPYSTITTTSKEKAYIGKVKRELKPMGIEVWKIDDAVEQIRKKSAGKIRLFVNPDNLFQQLKENGDIPNAETIESETSKANKTEYTIEKGYPTETIKGQKSKLLSAIDEALENAPADKERQKGEVTFGKPATFNRVKTIEVIFNGGRTQFKLKQETTGYWSGDWSLVEENGDIGIDGKTKIDKRIGNPQPLKKVKAFAEFYFRGEATPDGEILFKGENKDYEYKIPNSRYHLGNFRNAVKKSTGAKFSTTTDSKNTLSSLSEVVNKKTDIQGAIYRDDLGEVSLYWGNEGAAEKEYKNGSGISHIIARRLYEGEAPEQVAETVLQIIKTVESGRVSREYGGDIGRVDLELNDHVAVLSKQRFGKKEVWLLTGFKEKKGAGAKRESYNPKGYAPIDSVSRQKVVAALNKKISNESDSGKGKLQTDQKPGAGISLEEIKAQYPGQEITTNKDGSLSIRFKNGKGVRIKTVEHIGGDDYRFAVESGRMKKDGVILGKYQDGTITLNKNLADIETAIHENLHALVDMGILTPADLKSLDGHMQRLQRQGKYRYEIQKDAEENQANTLAQLIADRKEYREGSVVHRLIQKIQDFFDGLVNIGRMSARKLAREYESGRIYERDTQGKKPTTQNIEGNPVWGLHHEIKNQVKTYQGSAADFDKHDDEFIGSGEGNAFFGWGHYSSESKNVGKWYANNDAKRKGAFRLKTVAKIDPQKLKTLVGSKLEKYFDQNVVKDMSIDDFRKTFDLLFKYEEIHEKNNRRGGTKTLTVKDYSHAIEYGVHNIFSKNHDLFHRKHKGELYTPIIKGTSKEIAKVLHGKTIKVSPVKRNLYELSLHEGREHNYMSWYDRFSKEQAQQINDQAQKEGIRFRAKASSILNIFNPNTFEDLYSKLTKYFGDPESASKFLLRAGVDGVKYPVGSVSGVRSKTYNYVTFDANEIKIKKHSKYQTSDDFIFGKNGGDIDPVTSRKGKGDISTESNPVMPDGGIESAITKIISYLRDLDRYGDYYDMPDNLQSKYEGFEDYESFGIRAHQKKSKPGDELPPSYEWYADEEDYYKPLSYTSTVGLYKDSDVKEVVDRANSYGTSRFIPEDERRELILVAGDSAGYGQDEGEHQIRNAIRIDGTPLFPNLSRAPKKGAPNLSVSSDRSLAGEEDSFTTSGASTLLETAKHNIVNQLSSVSKVYKAIGKKIPEKADFKKKEQLRVSKAAKGIKQADKKFYDPIRRLIAQYDLTVENVDEFMYARTAPESNERLRRTNAKAYLQDLAKAQKGKALEDKIKALDAHFELNEFPTNEIQEGYMTLLERELKIENIRAHIAEAEQGLAKAQQSGNEKKIEFAQRRLNRAKTELRIKKNWDRFKAKPSGMTDGFVDTQDNEAADLMKKWGKHKGMQKIAKLFDQMNNNGLDIAHEAGRLSDEEYQAIKGTFQYYAPLMREGYEKQRGFKGIGSGVTNLGKEVSARGGSTKRAVHILANAILNHQKRIINAEKAKVAKAFIEFVKMNPNKEFWEFEEVKTKAGYDGHGNIVRRPAMDIKNDPGSNELKVKVDGKIYRMKADPENVHAMRIYSIIRGDRIDSNKVIQGLAKFNRILAAVNTTYNPEFVLSNLSRDVQTAMLNLESTDIAKMKGKVFKGIPKAMAGLKSQMRGDGKHEWAKWVERYEKSGAKIGWIDYGSDVEAKVKDLEKQIDIYREGHQVKKGIHHTVKFIEDYNSIVENAVRLSSFKAGIEAGMSESDAALMAKNLTVNFNQKGAAGTVINSMYLFANAGIQGSARTIKNLRHNPKRMAKILGGVASVAAGLAIANSSMGGEDDNGVKYYDQIDEYVKSRNIIILLPGSKGHPIKIPLPWGYNVFWAMGTELGDMFVKDDYEVLEGVSRMVTTAADAFNPLQSATIGQTISPTFFDPVMQVSENKSWHGGSLMPEQNRFSNTPKPDSQRYWKSVRPVSKGVAEFVNWASGGNKVEPGFADVSPETLDMLWDTFTGGAGRFWFDTAALPFGIANGDTNLSKTPIIRKLVGQKSEYKIGQDYQENITHVFRLKEQAEVYPGKRQSILKDKTFSLIGQAKSAESQIRKLRKALKRSNDKTRQGNIKKRIEKIQAKFNKAFYARRNA